MMMSTMEEVPTIEQLRAELRQAELDAREFREEADRLDRRARGLRVKIATMANGHEVERKPEPPSPQARLRDWAATVDFFTEEEALEHLAMPKVRFHELTKRLAEDGQLCIIGAGKSRRYAWVKPDHDATGRPKKEAVEKEVVGKVGRQRGDSVAGTGGGMVTRHKHMRSLVNEAKRNGATVTKGRGGHIKIVAPDGGVVRNGSTPGAEKMHKTEKELRNLGLAS